MQSTFTNVFFSNKGIIGYRKYQNWLTGLEIENILVTITQEILESTVKEIVLSTLFYAISVLCFSVCIVVCIVMVLLFLLF